MLPTSQDPITPLSNGNRTIISFTERKHKPDAAACASYNASVMSHLIKMKMGRNKSFFDQREMEKHVDKNDIRSKMLHKVPKILTLETIKN